jgi:hypothetical protein
MSGSAMVGLDFVRYGGSVARRLTHMICPKTSFFRGNYVF